MIAGKGDFCIQLTVKKNPCLWGIISTDNVLNPGEVLGIASDGDDRMEPKVKTQKNP